MREKLWLVITFLAGLFSGIIPSLWIKGIWDFKINIIDMLMLIATVSLSILVVYLTKLLEKKDIVRDIIVKELDKLCEIYEENSKTLQELEYDKIVIAQACDKVKMTFFRADLQIDRIRKQLCTSYPTYYKSREKELENITTPYYKWLTGGSLMEKDFELKPDFIRQHETKLNNTITDIKVVVHTLIRSF